MSDYLLSVCIRSYNQSNFIRDAIDSALMQRTNFSFEIIIGDDCSTDSTMDILLDYKTKYPEKIRVITNSTNIGGTLNLKKTIEASSAKYIALCDGDDYWTDSYKLQKQIDFLEENPYYVGCFHNVLNRNVDDSIRPSLFNPLDFPSTHTIESLINEKWFLPTNSEVFLREKLFFPDWYDEVINDDYVINLILVLSGPFFYMSDVMSVYRHHSKNESVIYKDPIYLNQKLIFIYKNIKSMFSQEEQILFDSKISLLNNEIKYFELEKKYPFRKFFRLRTYKKKVLRFISKF